MLIQQSKLEALKSYVDFHAHAGKLGSFMFGNALEPNVQLENLLFAKLVALNTINFDFAECIFSEKSMNTKDKRDGLTKEGSGRVAIYKATNLVNCYTLECNYWRAKRLNYIPARTNVQTHDIIPETPITDIRSKLYEGKTPPAFTLAHFEDIGRAVGSSLLDYIEKNPISRVKMSIYKSLEGIKKRLRTKAFSSGKSKKGDSAKKLGKQKLKGNENWAEPDIVIVTKQKGENGAYKIVEDIVETKDNTNEEAKSNN